MAIMKMILLYGP